MYMILWSRLWNLIQLHGSDLQDKRQDDGYVELLAILRNLFNLGDKVYDSPNRLLERCDLLSSQQSVIKDLELPSTYTSAHSYELCMKTMASP